MWLRRTSDSAQLLTVGLAPYAGDNRIAVKFQYPNNWRLSINPVKRGDVGLYMCQISTHPPRAILANLTVLRKSTVFLFILKMFFRTLPNCRLFYNSLYIVYFLVTQ